MYRAMVALSLTFGFLSCGGGGGETRITVPAATFPAGTTTNGAVDVRYDTTPASGAEITQVSYSINGGPEEYVYLRDRGYSRKGTLGRARIMLAPGENNIVFTVRDSAGGSTTYAVPNAPFYDFGRTPDRSAAQFAPSSAGGGAQYVTDQIVVIAKNGATDDQVTHAANVIGGSIVGQVNPVGMYWLQVPGQHSETQLKSLCDQLLAYHPGIFSAASLDTLHPIELPGPTAPGGASPNANATTDPWWSNGEWGLTAMKVPEVWDAYKNRLFDTKVGDVDNGFRTTHEDLQLLPANVYNRNIDDKNHGSHTMGTIGAMHNNAKGLAGVMDANRASLYGYDAFALVNGAYDSDIIAGLGWTVANGAKAVNFSLGAQNAPYSSTTDALYSGAMRNLLDRGYDFVVVHAAGNYVLDAIRGGLFAHITDPALRQRIITVGAVENGAFSHTDPELRQRIITVGDVDIYHFMLMAWFTNYGPLVDVVAPGVDILSSVATGDSLYSYNLGTSMAAPHVTGLAGLVWSADPGLTGPQVKQAIVDSAIESGHAVQDTREDVPVGERRTYYLPNAKAAVDKVIGAANVPVTSVSLNKTATSIGIGATDTL